MTAGGFMDAAPSIHLVPGGGSQAVPSAAPSVAPDRASGRASAAVRGIWPAHGARGLLALRDMPSESTPSTADVHRTLELASRVVRR
jgi:hypothetical protein